MPVLTSDHSDEKVHCPQDTTEVDNAVLHSLPSSHAPEVDVSNKGVEKEHTEEDAKESRTPKESGANGDQEVLERTLRRGRGQLQSAQRVRITHISHQDCAEPKHCEEQSCVTDFTQTL